MFSITFVVWPGNFCGCIWCMASLDLKTRVLKRCGVFHDYKWFDVKGNVDKKKRYIPKKMQEKG